MEPAPTILERAEKYFEKYERHISSAALLGGFIFDTLTLRSVDLLIENLTVISYLVISGGSILLINYFTEQRPERAATEKIYKFLPVFMQFAFGGLFSAFFIFYTRSGALGSSWIFFLLLFGLLVGNEFFKSYYQRLTFQVSIFFVSIFSFTIFFIPVMIKVIGVWVFLLSGVVSMVVIYLFSKLLFKVVPKSYSESERNLHIAVVAIFVIINIFYFTNLIPPIPLAIKEAHVYHNVEKVEQGYSVTKEVLSGWGKILSLLRIEIVHQRPGEPLYIFSSVFAPSGLNTQVVHNWQYFDEASDKWISVTRVPFSITGGRREGFRVFSKKDVISAGKWRVDIETPRGQVIGRVRFNIESTTLDRELTTEVL